MQCACLHHAEGHTPQAGVMIDCNVIFAFLEQSRIPLKKKQQEDDECETD